MQTAGKGRFNRNWYSPYGENIYFSWRSRVQRNLAGLGGLSLVVGLAMAELLKNKSLNEDVKLKWPNDIYVNDQK